MDSSFLDRYAVVDIYNRYCEIKSRAYACIDQGCAAEDEPQKANYLREALAQLLILVESRVHARSLFDELSKLKSMVELTVDFSEFSRFYDFVFFVCRENGQRNITVSRAVMAWRLVLAGRFRLLDPWCDFVEKNQRHNISEDTWRQVLAFSRCVHENLEGYDSAGAWPILIDDFVEYMYSIRGSTAPLSCNCVDSEGQQSLDDPLQGLKIAAGLKRKSWEDFKVQEPGGGLDSFDRSSYSTAKRKQCCYLNDNSVKWGENLMGNGENPMGNGANEYCMKIIKHCSSNSNSVVGCGKLVCAVEGCLSKGFAGLFSGRSCLQFGDHCGGLGQQPAHLKGSVPYM